MSRRDIRGGNYAAELQPTTAYRERRRRLAEAVGRGTIVVWGNGDDRGHGDVGSFRQSSTFFHLTGVELPNAILVLRPTEGLEALFLPPRNEGVERWTGPKWGPGEEAAEALGFDQVLSVAPSETVLDARVRPVPGFEGRLAGWLGEDDATLVTPYPTIAGDAPLPPTHAFVARLRERLPSFAVRDLTPHLTDLRLIKDAGEIELMTRAIEATAAGHRAAARAIAADVSEGTIDGVVYAAFRAAGAEGLAFPTIVGSGFNATTLHYDHNAGACAAGELVVVDIGARYGYYCGDLTRTYPVNGAFDDRQRELYLAVLAAHDRVAEAIRPGVTLFDLRKIAFTTLQEAAPRSRSGERLGQAFIHGLGHFLGLDAHDPGGDSVALAPGMVITNEPGIYLPDEGIGIRIEDDHLVTTDGQRNLSADLPTRPEEIEAMMGEEF